MEASMCGFATHADRPGVRTDGRRRPIPAEAYAEECTQRHGPMHATRSQAGRVEHALFALILGCVGCVWLGALLAEAARPL